MEAGQQAARMLGLEENPDSIQILKECLEQGAGVTLYPSKAAAAAMLARTSPEIWILPSSSERETYSLFSLTDGHAPSRHSFRVCGDLVHYCTTAEAL